MKTYVPETKFQLLLMMLTCVNHSIQREDYSKCWVYKDGEFKINCPVLQADMEEI